MTNDRKGALKKLKSLCFSSKSNLENFRNNLDSSFSSYFLPNGVEQSEYNYGGISCDVLAPEIYASNRVMLYIHGGSFVGGSRKSWRNFCASLASKCFCRVVVPEYRLAPENPYPASIDDIQSVFRALFTEEQVSCSLNATEGEKPLIPEIIIAADGSGASLVCAFLFNLRERYRKCIKNVVFFSPWLNVSPDSKILTTKRMSDELISGDVLRKSSMMYTETENTKLPFVSPIFATDEQLQGFPPVYIQMGAKEILLEDAKEFTKKLIESGNKCFLDVWENMMFMFQMADEFLHESHLALDRIGQIVTQNLAGLEEIKIENQPKLEHSLKSEA